MDSQDLRTIKGFTLIEAIISVAIFSMLVVGLVGFLGTMRSTRLHNQVILEIHDQGRDTARFISRVVREARSIDTPATGASSAELSLTMVDPVESPTIFSVADGVLSVTRGSNDPITLTNDKVSVSSLVFTNLSRPGTPGIVQFRLILENGPESGGTAEVYSQTFYGSAAIR